MFNKQAKRRLRLVIPLFTTVAMAHAQNFVVDWHTIDGGGGTASIGGNWELSGTIGQADAGAMAGGNWELLGGFWPGAVVASPADYDGDGDVDLGDYSNLVDCFDGPGGGADPTCDVYDSDDNGDIDLHEFAVLQTLFTGSSP